MGDIRGNKVIEMVFEMRRAILSKEKNRGHVGKIGILEKLVFQFFAFYLAL